MANAPSDLGRARLRKEEALARLRELQSGALEGRLRELQSGALEGRLLDRELVRSMWAQAFAALRDRALGMGDRIASRGAGRSPEELRVIVDSEVRDLLEAVSRGEF
jgi:hypothetical protein